MFPASATVLFRAALPPEPAQLAWAAGEALPLPRVAAQAEGFGAQWLTGWPAYDDGILRMLGLGPEERIAGFIHVGTPKLEAPERERPDPRALLTDWRPA